MTILQFMMSHRRVATGKSANKHNWTSFSMSDINYVGPFFSVIVVAFRLNSFQAFSSSDEAIHDVSSQSRHWQVGQQAHLKVFLNIFLERMQIFRLSFWPTEIRSASR